MIPAAVFSHAERGQPVYFCWPRPCGHLSLLFSGAPVTLLGTMARGRR